MYSKKSSENSDSDSETSLPDIADFFSPRSQTISPGDIVWAKFKHLYWPALVRAYYPNKKKISIWYCDEPGKTFKLPLKNVYQFHDSDMYTKILKDVKAAGVLKEHQGLTAHASTYLRRKLYGYEDDPMKFFDQTYPFFLVEEMLKKDPNADVGDIKIRPMYIDNAKKETIRKRVSARNNESDDSDLESEDKDSETKMNTSDFISTVNVQLHDKSSGSSKEIDLDVDTDEIIKCILSGKADDHLQKVKLQEIPSEHHDLFEKSLKTKRKNINEVSFTGPINNDSKLRKLIFYLLPLYEKMDNPMKDKCISSEKGKTLAVSSSFKNKNIEAQYVASVFLPESIIFAISKIKNISLAEAKKLFVGKSEYRAKAIESILAHADRYIQAKERTKCLVDNVLQNKDHGTSKQRRSEEDEYPSKKVRTDESDTVCDEKEIFSTSLKSKKHVKISDAVKSSETSSSKNEYEDKIFSCILSGKADDYLKKIKLKCIPSKHLDLYEESAKSGKKKLCNVTYTGPVKNDDKLRMLMLYLLPLYDDSNESHRSKRSAAKKCKSAMAAYYIDEKNPSVQYVIHVWLPESIILAISEIENVDLPEAKKLFDQHAEAKPVASLLELLDPDFSG